MLGLFLLLCCQPCECAQRTAERVKTAQVPAVCSCVSFDATRKPVHSYIDQPSGRCTYLTDWMYPIALYGYGICNHPSINIARVNQRGCFWGNSTRGGGGSRSPLEGWRAAGSCASTASTWQRCSLLCRVFSGQPVPQERIRVFVLLQGFFSASTGSV